MAEFTLEMGVNTPYIIGMNSLMYSANIIIPVFLLILLGMWTRKRGLIDAHFITTSSKVVFNLALPASIFTTIYQSDFISIFNPILVIITLGTTIIGFIMAQLLTKVFCTEKSQKGAFIQASVRANLAIFGMAIIERALSSEAAATGASLLVFLIPLYNFLAVLALTGGDKSGNRQERLKKQATNIIKNPLIIAIVLGVICSLLKLRLPNLVQISFSYLAKMTLPLALLGIGGTLQLKGLKSRWRPTLGASLTKLLIIPAMATFLAYQVGLEGESLAVIFILTGSPVAVSSFAMATALENDTELTADVITITTLFSIVTIGGGLAIMKTMGIV